HSGKVPDDATIQKFANERLVKGRVPGAGFFSNPLFSTDKTGITRVEAETKYKGQRFLEDIPADVAQALRTKLKAAGLPDPTDEDVRSAYQKLKAATAP